MHKRLSWILPALGGLGLVIALWLGTWAALLAVAAGVALLIVADAIRVRREERARRAYYWVSLRDSVGAGAQDRDRIEPGPSHLGIGPR